MQQSQKQGGAESQALSKTPPSSSRSADPASPQPPAHLALPLGFLGRQSVPLITYCPLPTGLPLPAAAVDPQASVQHFLGAASRRTSW